MRSHRVGLRGLLLLVPVVGFASISEIRGGLTDGQERPKSIASPCGAVDHWGFRSGSSFPVPVLCQALDGDLPIEPNSPAPHPFPIALPAVNHAGADSILTTRLFLFVMFASLPLEQSLLGWLPMN